MFGPGISARNWGKAADLLASEAIANLPSRPTGKPWLKKNSHQVQRILGSPSD